MITFEELEEMRIALKKKYTIFIIIGLIVVAIAALISFIFEFPPVLVMVGGVLTFVIAALVCSKPAKEYSLAFKNYFVKSSLQKKFTNLRY